jgi:quercetin dioxygenase-like cupin family protein
MKPLINIFIALQLVSALAFSISSFAEVKLGTRQVLLDNEKVEMVRLTYPPSTESGMHSHQYANRTVYFVKGGKLALIPQDKNQQTKLLTAPDGKVLYLQATTHNVKNIGDTEIIIIETEIK